MMKLLMLTCMVFFSVERSNAQLKLDRPVSEMLLQYQSDNVDTNKLPLLLQLSHYYIFKIDATPSDLDSAFIFIKKAQKQSATTYSPKWRDELLYLSGEYYYKVGKISQANVYFLKLLNGINKLSTTSEQVEHWHNLAFSIPPRDTIGLTRIDCLERLAALYQRVNDIERVLDTQQHIANSHLSQEKLNLAEQELIQILPKYKAIDSKHLHHTYNLLSVINNRKGDYNKALHHALLTIESMEKTDNKAAATNFYSRLANIYHELGQPENSIQYFRKVFNTPISNPVDCYTVREAGLFVRKLVEQNRGEEAFVFIRTFSKKHPPVDDYGKASLARTFAYYYNSIQNFSLAEKYAQQMIGLAQSLGKHNEIKGDVEYDIGQYYFDKKQYAKAVLHFNMALREARHTHSYTTISAIHAMLFKADSSKGDYLSAIKQLNQYQLINNYIFNETKSRQIEEVQVKYETDKKDIDIKLKEQSIQLLTKQGLLQKTWLQQADLVKNVTFGSIAFLLLIVGLLYNRYSIKQRSSNRLEAQQKEINDQNRSLQHLVSEKEWLLKEIHHRVKNNLQLTISLLQSQKKYLTDETAISAIDQSQHRVRAMALLHQKLYRSHSLSRIDTPDYIREVVEQLGETFDPDERIAFAYQLAPLELDIAQAVPLGLIINEAITNALKYAFPPSYRLTGQTCTVGLSLTRVDAESYLLTIDDNGIGLPQDVDLCRHESMGANIMRRLSQQLGGTLRVESSRGVTISVLFTLLNVQPHHAHVS